jgi:hypothetical protein
VGTNLFLGLRVEDKPLRVIENVDRGLLRPTVLPVPTSGGLVERAMKIRASPLARPQRVVPQPTRMGPRAGWMTGVEPPVTKKRCSSLLNWA